MSNQILNTLFDAHAFDGSPLHVDMPAYHIPFDDRGRTGVESGVVRAAHSSERLGVQGPIGCGKTSLLRYALDDPDGTVAPIWLSVAFDDDQVMLDMRRFAAHLVQSIVRDAQYDEALTADAVAALVELNRGRAGRNLRTTLGITHAALVCAVDRDAELIEAADVARAVMQQLDTGSAS